MSLGDIFTVTAFIGIAGPSIIIMLIILVAAFRKPENRPSRREYRPLIIQLFVGTIIFLALFHDYLRGIMRSLL